MKRFFPFALAAAALLSACQQQDPAPADPSPEAKPGLALSAGRLVLPAVRGNPGAAYFTLTNGGAAPATLAAVWIDGADKAEMHETAGGSMAPLAALEVKPGETVAFEPGAKHVMAFGLKPGLEPGGEAEMTVTFADGDKLSAPLKLEAAGGGDGSMKGMDH